VDSPRSLGGAKRNRAPEPEQEPVLVVDLDQSLSRSDTLYEALLQVAAREPWRAWALLLAVRRGRASFKAATAARLVPDPAGLLFNDDVLAEIETARRAGRRVAMVSAADQAVVDAVASHLDCFDEAYGSSAAHNLRGRHKADFLLERYGAGGYDYVGDCHADLAVWRHARRAITVGAGPGLRRAVDALGREVLHLTAPATGLRRWQGYLQAMRPHQWLKNVLVALPMFAAHALDGATVLATLAAFAAFCLTASSAYIVNDLLDLAADRSHPRKKLRAFASCRVPIAHGLIMAPALLALAVVICLVAGPPLLLAVLLIYYALTLAYSLVLKRRLVIDICTLACLYTLRIIAGAAATGLPLSPWILAFSVFLFLSLAAMKRQTELVHGQSEGRTEAAGRAYQAGDLPIVAMMAIAAGYISVMVLALYIASPIVQGLYASPVLLWGLCPILLYWVSRMVMIAHRGRMDDDPVVFAVRDTVSLACGACIVILGLMATYL
jgi:4-hydroxybenzoate polyprenyltransferase